MLVRGVRWRLVGSLLVVTTAAIAAGAAIVGPLFLRAGGDSLIRRAVAGAGVARTSFELVPVAHPATFEGLAAEQRSLLGSARLNGLYADHLALTMNAGVIVTRFTGQPYLGGLTYRTGICAFLRFTAGGCATAPGDAVVSDRMARRFRMSVGTTIAVRTIRGEHPSRIHITGVFAVPNPQSDYWLGDGPPHFPFGQDTGRPLFLPRYRRSVREQSRCLRASRGVRALDHHPAGIAVRSARRRECVGGTAGPAHPGAARRRRRLRDRDRSPGAALRTSASAGSDGHDRRGRGPSARPAGDLGADLGADAQRRPPAGRAAHRAPARVPASHPARGIDHRAGGALRDRGCAGDQPVRGSSCRRPRRSCSRTERWSSPTGGPTGASPLCW